MTHTPRILFAIAALAGGVLATPAQADDTSPDAVVAVRRFEVPAPRSGFLRLNTVQRVVSEPTEVRPVGGNAQAVASQPPVLGGAVQSGPTLALEQPGLPPGAREEAGRIGVLPIRPAASEPAQPVAPATIVTGPAVGATTSPDTAGVPPPPVFQTMKQAAIAVSASIPTAIAPVAPEVRDTSWRAQALAFITGHPMALPGAALFLVLLAFLFKRSRANRGGHGDDE